MAINRNTTFTLFRLMPTASEKAQGQVQKALAGYGSRDRNRMVTDIIARVDQWSVFQIRCNQEVEINQIARQTSTDWEKGSCPPPSA